MNCIHTAGTTQGSCDKCALEDAKRKIIVMEKIASDLSEGCASLQSQRDTYAEDVRILEQKIVQAEQRRDDLLADAERYRWLRSTQNTRSQESDDASGSYPIGTVDPIFVWVDDYRGEALMEECLDAAIDAAMEKERCHGG